MRAIAKRPGIVTFVAVVLIILGSLSLLGCVCGMSTWGLMTALPEPAGKPAPDDIFGNIVAADRFFAKEVPGFTVVSIGGIVVAFAFGLTQIIAGIGCWRLSPTARKVAIVSTVVYLLYALASQTFSAMYILPAQVAFQKQQQANMPPGAPGMSAVTQITGALGMGCAIAFYLTIAVLILTGLNMRSAKVAFGVVPAEAQGDDDDERSRHGIRPGDPRAKEDDGNSQHGIRPGDRRSKYEGYEEHDD